MARRTEKPVTRLSVFWHARALVPLCVRQGVTPRTIAQYKSYDAVVWWETLIDVPS